MVITLYNISGFGFNIIHANKLKTVLSIREDKIVERLFRNHKYLLAVTL